MIIMLNNDYFTSEEYDSLVVFLLERNVILPCHKKCYKGLMSTYNVFWGILKRPNLGKNDLWKPLKNQKFLENFFVKLHVFSF